MLNKTIITGRLCGDPEYRTTPNGTPCATFRLAVGRDYKDKATGERGTDFINVIAWRGTADFVARYLLKGRAVTVDGRLQSRDYTDKAGNKRNAVEVVAGSIYFADSKPESNDEPVATAPAKGRGRRAA